MSTEFSQSLRSKLEKNKWVKEVRKNSVRYTPKFIEYFHAQRTKGIPTKEIFFECGFADIYTQGRVQSLRRTHLGRTHRLHQQGILYTQQELDKLRKHRYVQHCTSKRIYYTPAFKKQAVMQYQQGISPVDTFNTAGFRFMNFNAAYVHGIAKNWAAKVHKHYGNLKTLEEKLGRRKKPKDITSMSIEEQNAYLKAENAYLKKLQSLIEARQQREYRKSSIRFME